jgi:hypothetical protein
MAVASLHGSIYRQGVKLCGYSILADRVLLALIPERPGAIGLALMDADNSVIRRLGEVRHRGLPFWGRGYFVCPCADEVAWRVLRYVDLTAVPEGGDALDPQVPSSAAEHAGFVKHGLLTVPPERLPSPMAWRAFLFEHEDEQFVQTLEFCLRAGKPFGPRSFVDRIEEACGQRLRASGVGWSRLFGGSGPAPTPDRVQPACASAASPLSPCRLSA